MTPEEPWELLKKSGNSDLKTQKRLLGTALPLFKNYPILVLGDREFHSPKLASWLDSRGVSFALRQKKDFQFQENLGKDYSLAQKPWLQAWDVQFLSEYFGK